ncbi:MAG: LolA-related protein [Polaromonas sp.]|uniref:LolA-related protein n=1 Tax=Polaromonas sp. TaxID=1869339 RepID=UPI00248752D4|nr:LolA-related protein [Polaromonas sp.]MDI1270872.1 outer membrane lipoprotein carrier protein LolA [Polaromonas sp.]MDO9112645.1 LolA-related protein [Polaromonas sp.]MDP1886531.1 LolA-related protein [Polaromonas sp.]MDP3757804.1 LolA-related protein [Polaromonas sp.]
MTDALRPTTPSRTTWLAGAGLLLALSVSPAFAAWDVTQLMQGLAKNKSGRASFVEKKYIALLEAPVESSGELLYTAPDRLEKRTLKPRPESLLIEGSSLTVERGKRRMVLRLQDYPELVAFTESIRGTLAGDMVALRRVYNLDLEGSEERWTLTLRPIETKMLEVVQRIRIGGSHAEVRTIEIEQTDKDRSVMVIDKLAAK